MGIQLWIWLDPDMIPITNCVKKSNHTQNFQDSSFGNQVRVGTLMKSLWKGFPTPKVEAYCWTVVTFKILTMDNLIHMGIVPSNTCSLCLHTVHLTWVLVGSLQYLLVSWGSEALQKEKVMQMTTKIVVWSLLKTRNERIFNIFIEAEGGNLWLNRGKNSSHISVKKG